MHGTTGSEVYNGRRGEGEGQNWENKMCGNLWKEPQSKGQIDMNEVLFRFIGFVL